VAGEKNWQLIRLPMRGRCENGDVAMTGFEAGGNADTRSPSGDSRQS
jgi:hypothetical protein